ncbi:MAG: hypothetical protein MUF00_10375, partial [Gemmatimonadaceae bacterium]|nr:hypothetical protein [Gemmatimonadaceae bacterium]
MPLPLTPRAALRRCARVALAIGLAAPHAQAHEIPKRVTAVVHARAEGAQLKVLVRVPLAAMRDIDVPLRGDGTIDLSRAMAAARDGAQLWVVPALALRAGPEALTTPMLEAVRIVAPSDASFRTIDAARAAMAVTGDTTLRDLPVPQALLDVQLAYALPDGADARALTIAPAFARLGERTSTVLHLWKDGTERVLIVDGDPGELPFDPSWVQAARR